MSSLKRTLSTILGRALRVSLRPLLIAVVLMSMVWLGTNLLSLLRTYDSPVGPPPTVAIGFVPDQYDTSTTLRVNRLYVTIDFKGCDAPQEVHLLAFTSHYGMPGSAYFGATHATNAGPRFTQPSGTKTEWLELDTTPSEPIPPSFDAIYDEPFVLRARVVGRGERVVAARFTANWTRPAGYQRCFLLLPSVITGDPLLTALESSERPSDRFAATPRAAQIALKGERGGVLPATIDLSGSGNPPASTTVAEWHCESALDRENRQTTFQEDTCAGWILLREPGASKSELLVFIYGTLLGVVLSLLVDLLLGAHSRSRAAGG